MFQVLTCLGGQHDLRLVALAGVVCFLASIAAVSLFRRARAAAGRPRAVWVTTAGIATGCGIWATHFVAMLAYEPGVLIGYDVGLTVASLVTAATVTGIGLAYAVYVPGKWSAPVGGGLVGGGVACMHYLGMWALEVPGRVTWSLDLVAVSILLGIAFGTAALAVATRRNDSRSTLVAALLLTVAIVSHHFTAMGAVEIVADPTRSVDAAALAPAGLALAIAAAAVAILGMCLIGAFADYRMALRAAEMTARLRSLAEATTEGLAICQDGIIIDGNTSLERLVGAPVKDLVGKPLQALLHNMHSSSALDVQPMEALVVTVRGEMIECEASARTMPYRGGTRTVVSFRDMRKQKAAEHRAHHDPLTGLPNRASFNEHLVATIEKSAAEGGSFAILCVDLDRFKEINDVFGHATGDALLAEVSRRLKTATEGAFLARLGGDEFTLIDAGRPHPAAAEALAARLQASVAGEIRVDDHHLRIGLSIGVAIYPADGGTPLELMANGDAALYRAKADGRGAIRFFEAEMDERIRERRALEHELRSAVARQELTLFYQPQARIDGQVTGFEALARWDHPTLGSIAPGRFIPIAEDSGIIVSLGEWVLREACREAATWVRPLQVSVNLSPIQFRHGDLPTLVHMALLDTGLPPGRLVLEITEGVLIDDFERALTTLRRLKLLGVGIAMDDFGTGYSSLSYLQSFPFDKIKIDRSFINNLARGHQSAAIVRAVIGLGRGLDLPVVAEGVETAEQQAFLSAEDCDEIQGYFVGRPGPMSDYAELVGLPPQPRPAAPATGQIAAA